MTVIATAILAARGSLHPFPGDLAILTEEGAAEARLEQLGSDMINGAREAQPSPRHWTWRRGGLILGVIVLGWMWTLASFFFAGLLLLEHDSEVATDAGWTVGYLPMLVTALAATAIGSRTGRRRHVLWRAVAASTGAWAVALVVTAVAVTN